ncbi:hypothetical protein M569_13318 [Genlisea aurea]|uniref:DYW domain-containing protein n=1 Tax=Genlisea aurea TaxID=192259 RepID=S8DP45_9LAMI|nr:hypothetical protein M569_13318 [Genlisea aurea]
MSPISLQFSSRIHRLPIPIPIPIPPGGDEFRRTISRNYSGSIKKESRRNCLLNPSSSSFTSDDPNSYLHHLCIQRQLKEAVGFLSSVGEGLRADIEEETFVLLVRLCEFERASDEGSFIYALVSRFISRLSLRLGNALLSMFVRLGNLSDAWYVFGRMERRDLFSWNVLIGGYAKNGFLEDSIDLYGRMLWISGVDAKPDVFTFPCVLRASGGLKNLRLGREIHVHLLKYGYESDVDVLNALITMYAKCGDLSGAAAVFDGMSQRDRISWNAIISGCFGNGEFSTGLRLFFSMRESGFHPDLMTMTSVISASEFWGDEILGRAVHGYVAKMDYGVEDSVSNSLIQMYSSYGRWDEAETVFSRIEFRDAVSWTSMISGYGNNGRPDKAVETYRTMEANGVDPDEITVAAVLSACSALGSSSDVVVGSDVHELARSSGFEDHILVSNALIDFYSKRASVDEALKVFHRMHEKNVVSWSSIINGLHINGRSFEALAYLSRMMKTTAPDPNAATLVSALSACSRIGSLMRGKEIHGYVLRKGLAFDGFLPNALLQMYVRCCGRGRTRLAKNQFRASSGRRDAASWNILLTDYAQKGRVSAVEKLFLRMIDSGVEPDEITFVALLVACSRSGMVDRGLEHFQRMKSEHSVAPNLKHYACVVDLLGRSGKLDDAHGVIREMPMEPDAAVWGALLNACRIHKRVDLGEIAAERIFRTGERGSGYYALLCGLYSESGKAMRGETGIRIPDPGCSWIEVRGKTHAFLSGDGSHPEIEGIVAVWEGIRERMIGDGWVIEEEEGDELLLSCGHSERLAVAFGLMNTSPGMPIRVTKNVGMCRACHGSMKFVSRVFRREVSVTETANFHHFKDGNCSCGE